MLDQVVAFFVFIISWFVDLFKVTFKRGNND